MKKESCPYTIHTSRDWSENTGWKGQGKEGVRHRLFSRFLGSWGSVQGMGRLTFS